VLTLEEKTFFANKVISGEKTVKELHLESKLSVNNLYSWVNIIKSGAKLSLKGRPSVIAEELLPKVVNFVENCKTSIPASLFEDEIHKYAIITAQDRNNTSESQVPRPSRRTLGRLEKRLKIKTGNAELTTNARAIACADVRNAVSMCAAQHLMIPLVDHFLILNMDATQYTVGNNSNEKTKVKFCTRPTKGKSLQVTKAKSNSGITALFIKHYLLISAGGVAADPVYLIADDNMSKEDIDVHVAFGLGNGIGLGSKGYGPERRGKAQKETQRPY